MRSIPDILGDAVESVLGAPAIIRAADPRFGDYQANGVMAVAKQRRENPRQLADQVIARLRVSDWCEPPSVAGAGFINFRLKPDFVAAQASAAAADQRQGVPLVLPAKTIVVDFSAPNVAKPMHVGHIRSTIIGDSLARVARFLGHRVVTDNHLGDWGTQFGLLIFGWKHSRDDAALQANGIGELERLYKLVNDQAKADPAVREAAKLELVHLQQGEPGNQAIWQRVIELSRAEFEQIYRRLGVAFDHTLGESFYNPLLAEVVAELRRLQLARESDGAICIFFEDDPELNSGSPLLIQKTDGAFLYGTTDLATIKYRIREWQPDEIIYVTDARQQLHFKQLFRAATNWANAGGLPKLPVLRHVWFGSILGEDRTPLKTREGAPVKLAQLLDEAEERAHAVVVAKNPELPAAEQRQIARVVGIGAVKYADLSQNRTTDYVFSWDKMLALNGNTAPYLQYAYVRVQSIFRKAGAAAAAGPIRLTEAAELELAKHLLRFTETLQAVLEDDKPNWLTSYLYELAGKFSVFYDTCPVLMSADPVRASRLALCRLTADVMKQGLSLLGIDVIEQM